jgi:hypothetical protein
MSMVHGQRPFPHKEGVGSQSIGDDGASHSRGLEEEASGDIGRKPMMEGQNMYHTVAARCMHNPFH